MVYADDILIISRDEASRDEALERLQVFLQEKELKVNEAKNKVGDLLSEDLGFFPLEYLGVDFRQERVPEEDDDPFGIYN